MLLGTEKIKETVDALLANIENDAEDELAEISEVFLIANVHYGNTDDDGDIGASFYRCTSAKGYVQRGLIEEARRAIDASVRPRDEE